MRADDATPRDRRRRPVRARHRSQVQRLAVSAVMIFAFLAATAYALDGVASEDTAPQSSRYPAGTPSPPASSRPPATPEPSPTPAPPVLALPDDFPSDGPGTFTFADGGGEELGESGELLTFRVAVEDGVDGDDPDTVARFVDRTLGHSQGWTAGGDRRFQRVGEGENHDFTVYLATTGTAAAMCGEGGVTVVGDGLPEGGVSCHTGGAVLLNLHRWRRSVEEFVDAEVPLSTYRRMLVNHEVGHAIGYGHRGCPEPGAPAPVMQQQTLALEGCDPNPWPYLDGELHTGAEHP